MKLVEQHIISRHHSFWEECDKLCFLSKNLYNQALYRIRQYFFKTGKYLNYYELQQELQNEKQIDYTALPAKVSQWILKLLDKNFKSFFKSLKAYKQTPSKFLGRPKLPSYKDKIEGRNLLTYTIQAISKPFLRNEIIKLSKTTISFRTKQKNIQQVRIIPRNNHYVIEVIYKKEEAEAVKDNGQYAAIDIGLNNLATVAFNFKEQPIIINGKPLKSINQFYNKIKGKLQSIINQQGKKRTKRLKQLDFKRNNKVKNYLHNASRLLVNHLVSLGVSKVIIGKNPNWKQEINIGKVNNDNFVKIPHAIFIEQLEYKLKLEGVEVIIREESYTSKCSFFDNEPIKKHNQYKGKRIKRSWFKTSTDKLVHADVNGALNIGKKQFSKAFTLEKIEGVVVHPMRWHISYS